MTLSQTEKMIVHNSAQGTNTPRYLVVCSVGLLRSPTIQMILYNEFRAECPSIRCAGLDDLALIPVSERLIEWADFVICVERAHADIIANDWGFEGPIYNFSIPDVYEYAHLDMITIIETRLQNLDEWEY